MLHLTQHTPAAVEEMQKAATVAHKIVDAMEAHFGERYDIAAVLNALNIAYLTCAQANPKVAALAVRQLELSLPFLNQLAADHAASKATTKH